MLMMRQKPAQTRFGGWPLAVKSILGFWSFYALTVVARAFLGTDPWTMLENKLVVITMAEQSIRADGATGGRAPWPLLGTRR